VSARLTITFGLSRGFGVLAIYFAPFAEATATLMP